MKNGTTSSLWFRLLNPELANVADLTGWIAGVWSTLCSTWFARAVLGDCCRVILAIFVTPAAVQDRDAAKTLITFLVGMFGRLQIIWADGGYLGALVQWVKQLRPFGKLRLEIVRRCHHTKGFKVLPKRWIVERTFGWFTKSRRLCRDYEVRLDHSEAMILICMIRLMLQLLAAV